MYYEGNSYFAALHLAGGAEEILGSYVERRGMSRRSKACSRSSETLQDFQRRNGVEIQRHH